MGCECAKPRYYRAASEAELQVSEYEDLLGYSKLNAADIWAVLQTSVDPFLPRNEMIAFLTILNLNREGFDSPMRPLHSFYSFFRRNNTWDKRKLALLGLLLGHGSLASKIDILFSLHASPSALKVSELDHSLRDLLHISSLCLPSYAQYWLETQNDSYKAEELMKYKEKLVIAVPDMVSMLENAIVPTGETEVGKEAFKTRMKGEVAGALFSARQLRVVSLVVYRRGRKERQNRQMVMSGEDLIVETD